MSQTYYSEDFVCDLYFEEHTPEMRQGIRGLASSSFFDNVPSKYHDSGDAISNSTIETDYNLGGTPKMGYITTDIYTSFVLLIGIFFPSCTGQFKNIFSQWDSNLKLMS